ncbi:MAG: FHA domain-containing protein [Fimbriimonas sp.]
MNDEAVLEESTLAPEGLDDAHADSAEPTVAKGRLTVKRGGVETAEVFEFIPPAVIGRFDPAVGPVDIDLGPLPEGAYVSRKHAKITFADGVWSVHDLGSSNGTFVLRDDFERVEESEIANGTEIALGNARFVFHV